MKKLSIIAAWLCALIYFGIQARAVAFGSFSGPDPGSNGKRLSIENLNDYKSFWTIPADTCFQSVTLSTQAEVDAFSCVVLVGHLAISGSDITSLEPLSSLKAVSSIRIFDCDSLANLNGLRSLEALTGINSGTDVALHIEDNAILSNIDALATLRAISDRDFTSIRIESNPRLKDVNGLSGLSSVPNALAIIDNARLENIDGLRNVALIGSTETGLTSSLLRITDNPSLKNLNGLSSLKIIQGRGAALDIVNNASLSNIDGLSSLTGIRGDLAAVIRIESNPMLKNINGLRSISSIDLGRSFLIRINNNDALENIDGLSSISQFNGTSLQSFAVEVTNNPSLTRCCGLKPLFNFIGPLVDEVVTISGNGAGCTKEDIAAGGTCGPALAGFSIINSKTRSVVTHFSETVTIDFADPDFADWTIMANTIPDSVGSVVFTLDETVRKIDNNFPYRLSRHILSSLSPGVHTLKGQVYSKKGGKGDEGISLTATITIINSATVESLQVVNLSGEVLWTLQDGDKINIQDPVYDSISIIAVTSPEKVSSVKFFLNDEFYNLDRYDPLSLTRSTDGLIKPWKAQPGEYTIKAIPFIRTFGRNHKGNSLEVTIELVSEAVETTLAKTTARSNRNPEDKEQSVSIYPMPVRDQLYLLMKESATGVLQLSVVNSEGHVILIEMLTIGKSSNIDLSEMVRPLRPGFYYLQLANELGKIETFRFIKE